MGAPVTPEQLEQLEKDVVLPWWLVDEVLAYLQDDHDIVDGSDGSPSPNRAMRLTTELEYALKRIP